MIRHWVFEYYKRNDADSGWVCRACTSTISGDDLERCLKHLAKRCSAVSSELQSSIVEEYNERYGRKRQKSQSTSSQQSSQFHNGQESIDFDRESDTGSFFGSSQSQPELQLESPLFQRAKAWHDSMSSRAQIDLTQAFASAIYQSGTPFSFVEQPVVKEFFRLLRPAFKLPTRKELAGQLLDQAYSQQKAEVRKAIEQGSRFTLVTDGWTNIKHESIINYMLVDPEGHSYFYGSDPTGFKRHNASYIAAEIVKVIEEVGPQKIIAVCTDNAANMVLALETVRRKFPRIHAVGCHSHQLNLVIKEILNIPQLKKAVTPLDAACAATSDKVGFAWQW